MMGDPVGAAALLRAAYRAMFEEFWRVCGRAVPLCVGQARSPQTASGGESALVGAGYDRLSLSHYVDNTAAHREKVFHVDSECVVVWDMYPKVRSPDTLRDVRMTSMRRAHAGSAASAAHPACVLRGRKEARRLARGAPAVSRDATPHCGHDCTARGRREAWHDHARRVRPWHCE